MADKHHDYLRKNTNNTERILRIVAALALIIWPVTAGWAQWAIALSAAIGGGLIFEGVAGYCLLYGILGWSTRAEASE